MEKVQTQVFCFLRAFLFLCFSGMTLKRSLRANKNVLDIGNESGMIEVIDSRTK
jgi:hypothetical protein